MRKLCLTILCVLLLGCSGLATDMAKSVIGLDDKPSIDADANLDVGANVQLGQENHNTKISKKATDKRLVTKESAVTNTAENLTQSWSVPWWALLIATLAGLMVDLPSLYERIKSINFKYSKPKDIV